MFVYLLKRILTGVLVLLVVLLLLVGMLAVSPIDASAMFISPDFPPVLQDQIRQSLGLDQGTFAYCLKWMGGLLHGDLQLSLVDRRPVSEILMRALPNTLVLSLCSLALIYLLGCLIGIYQAVRQYSKTDVTLTLTTLFIYSAPSFWLALMLILIASSISGGGWPIEGMTGNMIQMKQAAIDSAIAAGQVPRVSISIFERAWDYFQHLLLPMLALGIPSAAGIARYMRSSMLDVIRQDFVRTARAKGLSGRKVLFKHALRNALIPIITLLGLALPFLISGAVLVEYIFGWPGMGRTIVDAVKAFDYPVILATSIMLTAMVIFGNLAADLLYSVVDPRISHD